MKFKKSRFVISAPSDISANTIHLYHALYDHHLIVEETADCNVEHLFQKLDSGLKLSSDEQEALGQLAQMGIVVPADADEQGQFERWYSDVLLERSDSLVVHVTTTMACNLRCKYCMEQQRLDQSKFMEKQVADGTSAWIKRRIKSEGVRKLSLIFFGGEPLLNSGAIEKISGDLRDFCREEGVAFKAGAITNGTLLTDKMRDVVVRAGLSWVKVTLDGCEDWHDKYRIYQNGSGTFETIWNNLASAARGLGLFIGGNFSKANEDSCRALIGRLATAPWREALVDVRFKPIMSSVQTNAPLASGACDKGAFTPEQVERMIDLRHLIRQAGLPTMDDPNVGPCDFYRHNIMTVGVNGELYPCAGFVGLDEFVTGSVFHEESTEFGKKVRRLRSWSAKCSQCSYLPLCAGGCRLPAFLAGKSVEDTVCDLGFYERVVPHLVASYQGAEASGGRMSDIFA
jgi:uncharacterized protein